MSSPLSPSTFSLNGDSSPLASEMEFKITSWLLLLYTLKLLVADPTVVKTVSNSNVSLEKLNEKLFDEFKISFSFLQLKNRIIQITIIEENSNFI